MFFVLKLLDFQFDFFVELFMKKTLTKYLQLKQDAHPTLKKTIVNEWAMPNLNNLRASNGQFPKGQSGNPGGRPRDEQKVAELARSYTQEAIETLVGLMRSSNDERVRGTAAQALLDRGWGKPKVEVVSDEAGYVQALRAVAAKLDDEPDNRLS